jgi:hypothetical protein
MFPKGASMPLPISHALAEYTLREGEIVMRHFAVESVVQRSRTINRRRRRRTKTPTNTSRPDWRG